MSRSLLISLMAASIMMAASPATGAPADRSRLIVRGRVLDEGGRPIRDAWVVAKGSRRAASLVDTAGSFVLTIPGATVAEMTRTPFRIRLQARRRDLRISLANGAPELVIETRVVRDSAESSQLLVRSNDPVIAALVANAAVLEASPQMILEVNFAGAPGVQDEVEVTDLPSTQRVSLFGATGAPAVAPNQNTPTPASPGVTQTGGGPMAVTRPPATETRPPATVTRPPATVTRPPATETRPPAAVTRPPATDRSRTTDMRPPGRRGETCRCEIRGIVEIDSERPLQETMRVVLHVENQPAARDTVELFMGSPRAFQLGPVPCGQHRVAFTTRSKQRYRLTSLDPVVDCRGGGAHSVRLVLAPVGRGLSFR